MPGAFDELSAREATAGVRRGDAGWAAGSVCDAVAPIRGADSGYDAMALTRDAVLCGGVFTAVRKTAAGEVARSEVSTAACGVEIVGGLIATDGFDVVGCTAAVVSVALATVAGRRNRARTRTNDIGPSSATPTAATTTHTGIAQCFFGRDDDENSVLAAEGVARSARDARSLRSRCASFSASLIRLMVAVTAVYAVERPTTQNLWAVFPVESPLVQAAGCPDSS